MKKKISMIMVLILLLTVGLAGCSTGNESDAGVGEVQQEEQNLVQEHDAGDHDEEEHGEEGHDHGDYEWIGEFEFKAGSYLFHFGASEDETMDVGFIKMGSNIVDLDHHASHLMLTEKEVIKQDSTFEARPDYAYTFEMGEDHGHIHFTIKEEGTYAIVTEHFPQESNMQIFDENKVEILPIREHEAEGHSH
ncbi:hypothetical protein CACET_c25970 [Clostridium aceticum]|uniref:Uncharacterized protein n=1 Tax=Clostridium aceticum TaxID=84022 RepID=A0A0D8ICV8_9CLOT|nr:hypothetical protein [Clostridium aceticum]AKL96042.1 hypothetical protein CACET_c25970 [Clostridium aceticum]KJF27026.1 hypothetical protein TZ02_09450 [Clostridium aceticum]